jgi:hypothetical protein
VKLDWLKALSADWARLTDQERALFQRVVREQFHPACVRLQHDASTPWPRGLRVKRIQGLPGVWEMTWSFAGPDGRATFEWIEVEGELAVRWRRIGGHEIFGRP